MLNNLIRAATAALSISAVLTGPVSGAELTIKLAATELAKVPYVVPVVAPTATCGATSTLSPLIALGHRIEKEAQVSLFSLDAQGQPTGTPVVIKLPKSAAHAARANWPLSAVFHPTLPLLYVWQDLEGLKGDPVPPTDPAWTDFDHLLIYSLDGAAPDLLLSLCRGPKFHTGNLAGSIALDAAQGRLYVPNLRFGEKNPPDGLGVGWFNLAGDGLPLEGDEEALAAPAPVAPEKAAQDRPARVAALRAAAAAGTPLGAFRNTTPKNYGFVSPPAGAGIVPISRDVFIAGGTYGPVTWNLADRNARGQVLLMPINFASYQRVRITAHPRHPILYVTIAGYSYAHTMEHADGFLTLVPQVVLLNGAELRTVPVVLTQRNQIAWGTLGGIYLAGIEPATGRMTRNDGIVVSFPNMDIGGLTYSEKFDRLYIGVEKAP